ncbi:MAG: hypothetical protein ABIL58_05880 [Pseudomonadota bacterium]
MKFWMIVNIAELLDVPEGHDAFHRISADLLPEKRAPRILYRVKEEAIDEMLRLQQEYTDQLFVLVESVARCEPYLIPRKIFQVVGVLADTPQRQKSIKTARLPK